MGKLVDDLERRFYHLNESSEESFEPLDIYLGESFECSYGYRKKPRIGDEFQVNYNFFVYD